MDDLLPAEQIQNRILMLKGQRVLLDADLASLYCVTTKQLNQQVKRNPNRFPLAFCFQLTADESHALRSHFVTSKIGRGGRRYHPYAFTEHGALMAANVLSSQRAIAMSVQVIQAFVQLRQIFATHKTLAAKLDELDVRVSKHDKHLSSLIETIRLLTSPDSPIHGRKIGFHQDDR